ncbi:MAG: chemotaxis sensor histidine kinase CheA [Osedax symbiont Rs2]|nr:MAG: chemotaxis sensor histidine kinase CheA [Osedax symbiont Rs2]
MSLDVDQEILEDFLVEAGEILELLSEQLVELEQNPEDSDLLNAIFRGFHTVKGGAGFLQLDAMVDCCHHAENLFDLLRTGEIKVSAPLMDVVLQSLDAVNRMFENVRAGVPPQDADPKIMQQLNDFANPQGATAAAPVQAAAPVHQAAPAAQPLPKSPMSPADDFDLLLQESNTVKPAATNAPGNDLITEEEFDSLMDELHGSSGAPGKNNAAAPAVASAPAAPASLEDEFENLLDDLQATGQGAFTASPVADTSPVVVPENIAAPAATDTAEESVTKTVVKATEAANKGATKATPSKAPTPESNVRVDTRLLDKIMNMVGELVLVRNRLVRLGGSREDEEMSKALGTLDMVTADLQMSVMKTRMQPVKKVFGRFPRLIRDLSRTLKKEIRLELRGEETDLDKNLVEALADPLIHLVRNSVDHGIELPDVREKNGKAREGHVLLSAEQEGDHILLVIQDDGAGMDPEVLRGLAVQRGMLDQEAANRLSDQECFNLIFAAGFSTKEVVSDVSGRGVGMDVVKTKITQLNGTLAIDSVLGQGTRIAIQVPLTLAIMPTLMVILEDQAFALPLVNVNEIFNLDLTTTNVVDGQQVITVRDQALPLFHMKRWLIDGQSYADLPEQGHVVIVTVGTLRAGFVVDQLVGQEEVVIKPLGTILHGTPGLSGATITGDGRIALIIDIPNLLKEHA